MTSISEVKRLLWKEAQSQEILVRKTVNDFIFRVDYDDFWEDEAELLNNTPYIMFCMTNNKIPVLRLVERSKHKLLLVQLGAIVGRPLVWSTTAADSETKDFRKEMTKYYRKKNTNT